MSDLSNAVTVRSTAAMLRDQSLLVKIAYVLMSSWLLAASTQISVPMVPVPMTMQTYAVLLIGALSGARLGMAAVVTYLMQALIGLPFLANGLGGPVPFMGPTAGYLAGFVLSAGLAGFAADRGWLNSLPKTIAALLVAHLVVFLPGVGWLTAFLGDFDKAIAAGWVPFVPGTVLKTALAVVSVLAVQQVLRRRAEKL